MFYTLSKALLFALQPFYWLLILALWALYTRRAWLRRRILQSSLAILLIFSNPLLFDLACSRLEGKYGQPMNHEARIGIILGGYGKDIPSKNRFELNRAADRITEGLRIWRMGRVDRLLLSSGVFEEGYPDRTEAALSAQFLRDNGVPDSLILQEERSLNTYQNARECRNLLKANEREVLLISSAFHMPRAVACFEKQGFVVRPHPVDFMSQGLEFDCIHSYIPEPQLLWEWPIILKEWVGYRVYALKGYL